MYFAFGALLLTAIGLFLEVVRAGRPDAAARVLRYYWFRLADAAVPLATSLAAVSFAGALVRRGNRWGTILACVLALWCGGELLATAVARWQTPVPPAAKKVADNDVDKLEAWRDACQWIAAHTPADAVFLVPRSAQSFKWYASRADVVNWKDVPQDAAGVVQWQQRLKDSFPKVHRFGKSTTLDSPEKLSPQRLRVLAKRYGATYAIGAAYPPLDLPVAYSNAAAGKEAFTVYRIDDSEN